VYGPQNAPLSGNDGLPHYPSLLRVILYCMDHSHISLCLRLTILNLQFVICDSWDMETGLEHIWKDNYSMVRGKDTKMLSGKQQSKLQPPANKGISGNSNGDGNGDEGCSCSWGGGEGCSSGGGQGNGHCKANSWGKEKFNNQMTAEVW
jgi:hypothetical protein